MSRRVNAAILALRRISWRVSFNQHSLFMLLDQIPNGLRDTTLRLIDVPAAECWLRIDERSQTRQRQLSCWTLYITISASVRAASADIANENDHAPNPAILLKRKLVIGNETVGAENRSVTLRTFRSCFMIDATPVPVRRSKKRRRRQYHLSRFSDDVGKMRAACNSNRWLNSAIVLSADEQYDDREGPRNIWRRKWYDWIAADMRQRSDNHFRWAAIIGVKQAPTTGKGDGFTAAVDPRDVTQL